MSVYTRSPTVRRFVPQPTPPSVPSPNIRDTPFNQNPDRPQSDGNVTQADVQRVTSARRRSGGGGGSSSPAPTPTQTSSPAQPESPPQQETSAQQSAQSPQVQSRVTQQSGFERALMQREEQERQMSSGAGLEVTFDSSGRYGYSVPPDQAEKVRAGLRFSTQQYGATSVTGRTETLPEARARSIPANPDTWRPAGFERWRLRTVGRLQDDRDIRAQQIEQRGTSFITREQLPPTFDRFGRPVSQSRVSFDFAQSAGDGLQQSRDSLALALFQPAQTAKDVARFGWQLARRPVETTRNVGSQLIRDARTNPYAFTSSLVVESYGFTRASNIATRSSVAQRIIANRNRVLELQRRQIAEVQYDYRLPVQRESTPFRTPSPDTPSFAVVPNLIDAPNTRTLQTVQTTPTGMFDVPYVRRVEQVGDGIVRTRNPYTLPVRERQTQLSPRPFEPIQQQPYVPTGFMRQGEVMRTADLRTFVPPPLDSSTQMWLRYLDQTSNNPQDRFIRQSQLYEYTWNAPRMETSRPLSSQRVAQAETSRGRLLFLTPVPFPTKQLYDIEFNPFRKFQSDFKIAGTGGLPSEKTASTVSQQLPSSNPPIFSRQSTPTSDIGQVRDVRIIETTIFGDSPIQILDVSAQQSPSIATRQPQAQQQTPAISQTPAIGQRTGSRGAQRQQQAQQQIVQPVQILAPQTAPAQRVQNQFRLRQAQPMQPIKPPFRMPTRTRPQEQRQERLFNVLVRRAGRFELASPLGFSQKEAKAFGANIVSNTARASFKLVETDSSPRGTFRRAVNLEDFNLKNGIFIEKPSKRITTMGELREITFKGLQTIRSRSRFRL